MDALGPPKWVVACKTEKGKEVGFYFTAASLALVRCNKTSRGTAPGSPIFADSRLSIPAPLTLTSNVFGTRNNETSFDSLRVSLLTDRIAASTGATPRSGHDHQAFAVPANTARASSSERTIGRTSSSPRVMSMAVNHRTRIKQDELAATACDGFCGHYQMANSGGGDEANPRHIDHDIASRFCRCC